jgi:xanthine dehydrogenase accessory factor
MESKLLTLLNARREQKKAIALVTMLSGRGQWLVGEDVDGGAPEKIVNSARMALANDKNQLVDNAGSAYFIHVHNPPLRMVLVGAVHIAQALAVMASAVGYEVIIVDPRGAFATEERFPGLEISNEWPDEALQKFSLDARSAVVTLTHDPKLDDAALEVALASEAFYIGSLGSKKTHGARLKRLERLGIDKEATATIHGPVGLPIGARSPAEIALAIMSEVTQVRHSLERV